MCMDIYPENVHRHGYYKHNFVVTLGFAVVMVRNLNDWFLQTLTTRMRMQKWMLQVMVRVRSLY